MGQSPKNSGVLYEAVEGEHPVIKGSELVTDWKKVIPNTRFGEWNPFALAEEQGGVYTLVLHVPRVLSEIICEPVSAQSHGKTRISAMAFETPDGSGVDLSFDFLDVHYGDIVPSGPSASLKAGNNGFVFGKNKTKRKDWGWNELFSSSFWEKRSVVCGSSV